MVFEKAWKTPAFFFLHLNPLFLHVTPLFLHLVHKTSITPCGPLYLCKRIHY